jgi:hypothetical protein
MSPAPNKGAGAFSYLGGMKKSTFLIMVVLVTLGLLMRAFSNGNPWELFKKQIEASKALGRAH